MDDSIAPTIHRLLADIRELAGRLTPLDPARLTRELVRTVYEPVKFDALLGGYLVGGPDRELDGLGPISNEAELWYEYLATEQIEGLRGTDR